MQTKNLIKIIKAESSVLESMIESLPDDGEIQQYVIEMLQNKIRDLSNIASHLTDSQPVVNQEQNASLASNSESPIYVEPAIKEYNAAKEQPKPEEQQHIVVVQSKVAKSADDTSTVLVPETKPEPEQPQAGNNQQSLADMFADNTVSIEQTYTEESSAEETSTIPDSETPTSRPSTLADKFQHTSPSINDVLAGLEKKSDLASKFNNRPITNLRKAIKINDRIRFINELFNHDSIQYEQTIDMIEQSSDINEALTNIFSKYQWDQENTSTISFLELVYQRFKS